MIISFFLALQLPAWAQECKLQLSGHVVDLDTKENLSGATVRIEELNKSLVTDVNGNFRYGNICPGQYTIQVTHTGCAPLKQVLTLVKNTHTDFRMPHLRSNLDQVIVVGKKNEMPGGFKQQLDAKAIESSRGSSLAEALSKINGVNMLQTGPTIAKPVVHGLHSIRVLTINNEIRHEGQQWGNEHAPEIDTYIAENLTVVKGVDELKYGSDAIGGVVLIDPRPLRQLGGNNAELNAGYFTNNQQYTLSGMFEQRLKKLPAFAFRVQGTFKKGGNINTPHYRLNNTGVTEKNFSATADWKKEHYHLQAYYSQFQTTIGLFPYAHVGNITDLIERISSARPDDVFLGEKTYSVGRPRQEVLHRLLKLKSTFMRNGHRINFTLGAQYNHRDEFDVVRDPANTSPQIGLALISLSEELIYEHPAMNRFAGSIGVALSQQDNSYSGRYFIPNYRLNSYGAFWIEKWKKNNLDIEVGLRFDNKTINTSRLRYEGTEIDHNFKFSTLAASLSSGYRFSGGIRINGAVTLASRSPHVNELLAGGVHQSEGGYAYIQGNIGLRTEKSVNFSASIKYDVEGKKFSAEANVYHHLIHDFIFQQPRPDQPVLTITGAAPMREYLQTDAALSGTDVSAFYRFTKSIRYSSRISVLMARNQSARDWLILMPPDRWRNELAYYFSNTKNIKDASVAAELVNVFRPRTPGEENGKQDYKDAPGPYSLLNIEAAGTLGFFKTPIILGLSVRNALNTSYRDYMNAFRYFSDEMGRNIVLRIKVPIDQLF